MKRDPRLIHLSSEHHQALVLGRSLSLSAQRWTPSAAEQLGARFDAEIAPHFELEETVLLPALLREGAAAALVERTLDDHRVLSELLAAARAGHGPSARAFGERLIEHVRFEERALFPACEQLLSGDVLDEVARRVRPRR